MRQEELDGADIDMGVELGGGDLVILEVSFELRESAVSGIPGGLVSFLGDRHLGVVGCYLLVKIVVVVVM